MTRLPQSGSDAGTWGEILNEFLGVEHNNDGTLKSTGSLAAKADDIAVVHNSGNETVSGTKIFNSSPVVPTPTLPTQAANKSYVDAAAASGTPDATTLVKGKIQLAGDLGGTADAPTVPGLAGKADASALAGKEASIAVGTTSQYYRGDKTWQTLDKTAVGLNNVDNTTDVDKPVSTAQAAADNLRVLKSGDTLTGTLNSQTITPTTSATYTLGDSTHYWTDAYFGRLNLNSTASIDGTTAGQINLNGNVLITSTVGTLNTIEVTGNVANTISNARSFRANQTFTGSGDGVGGIESKTIFSPSVNITNAYGFINTARAANAAGTDIANLIAGFNRIDSGSTGGTVTAASTMYVASPSLGTVKPATLYGIQLLNQGAAGITTSYGIKIANQTGAGTSYGIITGTGVNSFGDLTGIMTVSPTHSLTLGSTATGTAFYNTADQITNYERAREFWNSNVFTIATEAGGTGTKRNITLKTLSRSITINEVGGTTGMLQFVAGTNSPDSNQAVFSGNWGAPSGLNVMVAISPLIVQTGTAGYTALLVNPTESTTGSGPKLLADFQIGSTSKVKIDNTGTITLVDAANIAAGTTTGTKIGTATTQKLGFYNATPVVQPTGNALTALSTLGLVSSPTLAKADVGLGNVDNTSDTNKPVSTAAQTALNAKLTATSNLSDLASASTARTNLGLGGAATLAVGTTTGTVAAGDDARFVGTGGTTDVVTVSGATYTFPRSNGVWKGTLQASCTFTLPSVSSGGPEVIISALFIQDATGGRVVTLPTGASSPSCLWASGIAPSIPTTLSSQSKVIFQNIDGQWFGMLAGASYS